MSAAESCGCERGYLCSYHEGFEDGLSEADSTPADNVCRGCDRHVVCAGCSRTPADCTCDSVFADLEEVGPNGEDTADLDPLTRTLLGLPSGIHCHNEAGACLSGHCERTPE